QRDAYLRRAGQERLGEVAIDREFSAGIQLGDGVNRAWRLRGTDLDVPVALHREVARAAHGDRHVTEADLASAQRPGLELALVGGELDRLAYRAFERYRPRRLKC